MSELREVRATGVEREELIRFFSVLSHDLKSPIFSIDGFSDLLLSDYGDRLDEEGKDFLARIRSAAQQMKRVLDGMNHLVKLLTRTDSPRAVDLNEVVEEIRLKQAYAIENAGVTFGVDGTLPTVSADPEKIREALAALISNAVTFADPAKSEKTVRVRSTEERGETRLCVIDNGIGIDSRYVAQIFDLGLKLDKSVGDGPGYGLYLAKNVAEGAGGRVDVTSEPGQGSRFCLVLPHA